MRFIMDNLQEKDIIDYNDEWKLDLRKQLLKGIAGTDEERQNATINTGIYYQSSAPETIYKYYSDSQRNLDAVFDNKMWYSSPTEFNDVFDCDISVDKKSILDSLLKLTPKDIPIRPGSPTWKKINEKLTKGIHDILMAFNKEKSQVGVACFSELEDSLLMWSHYAHNHKGLCVEYNLLDMNKQLGFTPIPVIYSNNRVCLSELNIDNIERDSLILTICALSSKSPEWSYEKEWRVIRDHKACGKLWDYDKKGALLDMLAPTSIILGCEATKEFVIKVKAYCKSKKINLYQMEKDAEQYKLNKKEIFIFHK